jgi:hypothetical protein
MCTKAESRKAPPRAVWRRRADASSCDNDASGTSKGIGSRLFESMLKGKIRLWVRSLPQVAFALRCSTAAVLGWHLSILLGLAEPLWAATSSLIISQVGLRDTKLYSKERIVGSLFGIAVSATVHAASTPFCMSSMTQIAIAVAVCAVIAHRKPSLRVAMWTCPITLAPLPSDLTAVTSIAADRGLAVVVGATVGFALHWLAEFLCVLSTERK